MPVGVRYISKALPPLDEKLSTEERIRALHKQASERFGEMYVEDGGGSSSSDAISGSSLTFSLAYIVLTSNQIVTEAFLAQQGYPEASGSGILFIAFEQDATGGHLLTWDDLEWVGAGTFDTEQWHVDTRPGRVTVFTFVRNPFETLNRWWLVSALSSYDAPEYTEA